VDADDWTGDEQDEQLPVRRRLIDEVIAPGVPAVSAHSAGRRSLWPAFLFVLGPLMVLAILWFT